MSLFRFSTFNIHISFCNKHAPRAWTPFFSASTFPHQRNDNTKHTLLFMSLCLCECAQRRRDERESMRLNLLMLLTLELRYLQALLPHYLYLIKCEQLWTLCTQKHGEWQSAQPPVEPPADARSLIGVGIVMKVACPLLGLRIVLRSVRSFVPRYMARTTLRAHRSSALLITAVPPGRFSAHTHTFSCRG